jgi:hypothetical protein
MSSRSRRAAERPLRWWIAACALLEAAGCGGTTGHEGLPIADSASVDASVDDSSVDAGVIVGEFDVTVGYADPDRLPDVSAPPDTGTPDASEGGCPFASPADAGPCIFGDGGASCPCVGANDAGGCTATEQLLMCKDPSGLCYQCMLTNGCIDDAPVGSIPGVTTYGDVGLECEDLASGVYMGETQEQLCLDAVTCALASGCGGAAPPNAASSVNCYCGTVTGTVCSAGGAVGQCASAQATAAKSSVPTEIIGRASNSAFPIGMADSMIQCAITNGCTRCYL